MKTQEIQSHLNYIADYCNNSVKFNVEDKKDRNVKILLKSLAKKIRSKKI